MHIFWTFLLIALLGVTMPGSARANNGIYDTLAAGGSGGWLNVTRPLTAADMQGRLVLLDFWTYGCINCMQIVPDLEYLEQKFGDKLLVIGVHSAKFTAEQGSDRILAAAQRFGLHHPVINDSDFAIWKAFNVRAWPTLVLLGPDGSVLGRYEGEGNRADIERDIISALSDVSAQSSVAALIPEAKHKDLLSFPSRLAYDPARDMFFVTDSGHNRILAFDKSGTVRLTIGNGGRGLKDGNFETAQFNNPRGLAFMKGFLYVADTNNHALRRIDFDRQMVETLAGNGRRGYERDPRNEPAKETQLASPWDVEPLPNGRLAIAMAGTHQLWVYDAAQNTLSLLAGSGWEDIKDGQSLRAALAQPSGMSSDGHSLFFVDAESSSLRVLAPDQNIKTLIGTGLFTFGYVEGSYPEARLQHPQGLYADAGRILIADTYNNVIRTYDRKTQELSTFKIAGEPPLNEPGDVLVQGGSAWVADTNNHKIRRIDLDRRTLETISLQGPKE